MANKFYITTPIYYVNASPHIGHSYTCIAADSLARHYRQKLGENDVWFLTGSDEHGQKIQKAADEAKLSPQEFVDKVVMQFKGLWGKLDISNNDFIRTTEARHIKTVQKVLEILHEKGDIYQDKYEGWYCTPCETFWMELQLKDGKCPDCGRSVEKISETNYFFKLKKYQEWLVKYIKDNPNFIRPETRRNEVLSFLALNELADLCISRPSERLGWGIPLPFSPEHVTYVWFDALVNYISAVGSFDAKGKYSSPWWGPDVNILHLIGKDILRQHAIYWPIILHALDIELPKEMTIFAHGWWLIADAKMSKSKGNVVSPLAMVDKFGIDTYRYFLLRDVPFGMDGNFSEDAIIKRFNGDLANDLGNLVYRTLTMIEKYYQGNIPDININNIHAGRAKDIIEKMKLLPNKNGPLLCAGFDFNFGAVLENIWGLINSANKYVEETKPWNLAKENKTEELKQFIRLLVEVIREVAGAITPFMPRTAESIKEQLGSDKIKKGAPLFPRIDAKKSNA
ncbi:MAG: methionine--tRNA ligase [Candidatus Omnitrophica bacterium]|nr:methionine--tRNA ligase [Candidatus Omnitrophota bacterium]